jgi:manganese/zinc/iron transport system permease protein
LSDGLYSFVQIDLLPLATGTLAAVTCGLLGNFLVLRRLSLMGDAISHSVLPGLVIAFLVSGMRSAWPMFVGAAVAGVATVILVEVVKKLGRIESGAAMGVVFSVLFALGVLLIERAAARNVHLDADCVLHGQLEFLFWFPPQSWDEFLSLSTLNALPRQVVTLVVMLLLAFVFVTLFFKELRIAAFDPALATTQGFHAGLLHYMLMIFVAAATVASFEAVGSILVVAMLVCPAATARLLTDRLLPHLAWSVIVATASGVLGYFAATAVPAAMGQDAVNAAGMMTVVAGLLLAVAMVGSPRHGLVTRLWRRHALAQRVALDDLLATLYRIRESGKLAPSVGRLPALLPARNTHQAIELAKRRGLITQRGEVVDLSPAGQTAAEEVIRRHRLWESYLVDEANLPAHRVHGQAERLEHVPVQPPGRATVDPHGRDIPPGERAGRSDDRGDAGDAPQLEEQWPDDRA